MKIGCVCPTYKRPQLLGRAIHCFLRQSYTNAYLVVLDDAGQYESREHEHWKLVSQDQRYASLGGKRQAGIGMLPADCDAYMRWDDDDVYFPHALQSVAAALARKPWAQPRLVYETGKGPSWLQATEAFAVSPVTRRENWGYGGCWAYTLDAHQALGGYDDNPERSCNDDLDMAHKALRKFGPSADSTADVHPWYWYNRDPGVTKISDEGVDFWQLRADLPHTPMTAPPIGWNGPNVYEYTVGDGVQPRPF